MKLEDIDKVQSILVALKTLQGEKTLKDSKLVIEFWRKNANETSVYAVIPNDLGLNDAVVDAITHVLVTELRVKYGVSVGEPQVTHRVHPADVLRGSSHLETPVQSFYDK